MNAELSGNGCDGQASNGNPMSNPNPLSNSPAPKPPRGGKVCGAQKKGGGTCQARPCANGRCRVHGGLTPAGIASPHYKHGRHSKYLKYLPTELKKAFKNALADPELTRLGDELALLTARASQLLERLAQTESPPWGKAVEALNDTKVARSEEDWERAFGALEQVIRTGADAAASQELTWAELQQVIQEKTRVAAVEHKCEVDDQVLVRIDYATMLLRALLDCVYEVLNDLTIPREKMLQVFNQKVLKLLPQPDRQRPVVDVD
jgi:hypothetical protein